MARAKNLTKPARLKRQTKVSAEPGFRPVAMPMLDLEVIEAADPSVLVALQQFEELQSHCKATEADFLELVKLIHDAGCSAEAEYLLRSSLLVAKDEPSPYEEDKDGLALYVELFGTAKQETFATAIAAFSKQFSAKLTKAAGSTFFMGYHTVPRSACFAQYRMQNEPSYVRFEYEHRINLDAWVESQKSEDQLIVLRWVSPLWEIIGKGMSTRVYDIGRRRTSR